MKSPRSLFRSRPHGQPPAYLPAVVAIGKTATPGVVTHVNVCHDDWCGIFKGTPCDCNPVVKLAQTPERN